MPDLNEFAIQIMIIVFIVLAVVVGLVSDHVPSGRSALLEPEECEQWELPAPPQCARMVLTDKDEEWCHAQTLVAWSWCDYSR